MSYRDDRDADQARITALEAELAAARRRIGDLEGHRSQALVLASPVSIAGGPPRPPWYGAPLRLELVRSFDGEFPRDELETLVESLRSVTKDHGRTELLKSSVTWSSSTSERQLGPFLTVTVAIKDGRTTLTATDRLSQLAAGIYGGLGGGLGGGGIVVPIIAAISVPVLMPVAIVGWLGGFFLGSRALFKRAARQRALVLQRVFDAVAQDVAAKIPAR